ncbi:MAG: hypothetical protein DME87_03895, partial [Verrucomicrobia bacterium]
RSETYSILKHNASSQLPVLRKKAQPPTSDLFALRDPRSEFRNRAPLSAFRSPQFFVLHPFFPLLIRKSFR